MMAVLPVEAERFIDGNPRMLPEVVEPHENVPLTRSAGVRAGGRTKHQFVRDRLPLTLGDPRLLAALMARCCH